MISIPVFVYFYYQKKKGKVEGSLFDEFYGGTKDKKIAKLFIVMFFIRRFTTVAVLVCLRSIPSIPRCAVFCILQITNLVFLVKIKPFESNKDNIIEILNE